MQTKNIFQSTANQIERSAKHSKTFLFKLFIHTGQGQDFETGRIRIDAENYDSALKTFRSKDLPFHHHSTVENLNKQL